MTTQNPPRSVLPTLSNTQRNALWALCAEIATVAQHSADYKETELSISDQVDLAQYLEAWSRASGDAGAADAARLHFDCVCARLATARLPLHWIGGLSGVVSSLSALARSGANTSADFSEDFDQALLRLMSAPNWHGDYDLIVGLTGYGLYALEHADQHFRNRLIKQVLHRLAALGRQDDQGLRWHTGAELLHAAQRQRYPNGHHNLGLAHGAAGVIGLLARCIEADCHAAMATDMLRPAVAWLLAQGSCPDEHGVGWFPNVVESPGQSRPLAWCYGDLGIAVALLRAAAVSGNGWWRETALQVASDCATRRGPPAAVVDSGLCHGSAGAALIFLRCWQHTGEPSFADSAHHWLLQTLHGRRPDLPESAGIFSTHGSLDAPSTSPALGLLTGAAGVGLTLLSCLGEADQYWDAPLLTDLRSEDRP